MRSSHPKPYVIYTRKSTDDLDNQQNSIEFQVSRCLTYVRQNGLSLTTANERLFVEHGIIKERHSAYKTGRVELARDGAVQYRIERPKFQLLVERLLAGKYAGVVALRADRFSRNELDYAIISDLLRRGVDIRYVDVDYGRSSSGQLHRDIDSVFAVHWSRASSEKIREVNAKLRAEGKITNRSAIGYLDHGTGNKRLDPVRAPIIAEIFRRYATGDWGLRQLALWAAEQGLLTKPTRGRRTREEMLEGSENTRAPVCRPVNYQSISKILGNPVYAGLLRHNGEILPATHEPIVSRALFDRVQLVLSGKHRNIHHLDKRFFPFRGLVRCACGRLYSPYLRKTRYVYYFATCRGECANSIRNITEETIRTALSEILEQLTLPPEDQAWLEETAAEAERAVLVAQEAEKVQRTTQRARQKEQLQKDLRYLEEHKITLLREGVYDAASYADEARRLEAAIADLERPEREVRPIEALQTLLEPLELVEMAQQTFISASPERTQEIAASLVLELVICDGKLAGFSPKEGIDTLLEVKGVALCAQGGT